jgi:hypothetical protein
VSNYRYALRPLRKMYGGTPAAEFGPLALKALQQTFIAEGRSRNYINSTVKKIRHMFRWGVSEELIPSFVFEALKTVEGLKAGRSAARETERIKPVSNELVNATLPHCCAQVRDDPASTADRNAPGRSGGDAPR